LFEITQRARQNARMLMIVSVFSRLDRDRRPERRLPDPRIVTLVSRAERV
jgi:hypothetical protein